MSSSSIAAALAAAAAWAAAAPASGPPVAARCGPQLSPPSAAPAALRRGFPLELPTRTLSCPREFWWWSTMLYHPQTSVRPRKSGDGPLAALPWPHRGLRVVQHRRPPPELARAAQGARGQFQREAPPERRPGGAPEGLP